MTRKTYVQAVLAAVLANAAIVRSRRKIKGHVSGI